MSKSKRRSPSGPSKKRPGKTSSPHSRSLSLLGWLLGGAWLFILLYYDIRAEEHFRTPKLILSNVLALLSLAWLCLAAAEKKHWLPKTQQIDWKTAIRQPAVLLGIALFSAASLSWIASEHTAYIRRAAPSFLIGISCLVGWSLLLSDEQHRRLFALMAKVAALASSLILLSHWGILNPASQSEIQIYQEEAQLFDRTWFLYIGSGLDLGAFLLLPLLYTQWQIRQTAGEKRIFWILALLPQLECLRSAGAYSSILAIFLASITLWVGLLMNGALLKRGWTKDLPKKRVLWAVGLVSMTLLLVVGSLYRTQTLGRQVLKLVSSDQPTTLMVNRLTSGRVEGWLAGYRMWQEHPITGVGLGAYAAEFGEMKLAYQAEGSDWFLRLGAPYFDHSHNEFFQVLAELGGFGILVLLAALVLLILRLRQRKTEGTPGEDRAFHWAGCTGFFFLSIFGFPFHVAVGAYPALLLVSWILHRDAAPEPDLEEREAAVSPWGRRIATVCSILLLTTTVFYVQEGVRRWQASRTLKEVVFITSILNQIKPDQRVPILRSYLVKLENAHTLDPVDAHILIARAGIYMLLNRPEEAVETYLLAEDLEPRATVYANLGRAYDMLDRHDEAVEAYIKAVRLDRKRWLPYFRKDLPPSELQRLRQEKQRQSGQSQSEQSQSGQSQSEQSQSGQPQSE